MPNVSTTLSDAVRRRSRALVCGVLVAVAVATSVPGAGAQSGMPFARWIGVSGTCWNDALSLEGSVQADLPLDATVVFDYGVANASGSVDLGDAVVAATALTAATQTYADEILFGARFVPGFPYTYVQDASTRVGGTEVYGIELQARCLGHGEPAIITVTERGGPVPPPPAPPPTPAQPVAGVPRFTG